MIYFFFLLYRLIFIPLAALAIPLIALFNSKVRTGLVLRMKVRSLRYPLSERPFWIHASSGEFEYAKPVIRELKKQFPTIPILVTYFSPSYKDQIARFSGVDRFEPLPLDLPGAVHSFLEFHKPRALLIARTDLWPELLWQVSRKRIPSLLFSHTRKKSTPLLHFYFRVIYALLTEIFVVSEKDAFEVGKTSVNPFMAAGDTRYDQVHFRLGEARRLPATVERLVVAGGDFAVIAGSTWGEDEDILLPAFAALKEFPLRFILVPHETDEHHLSTLKKKASHLNLMLRFASSTEDTRESRVSVIDHKGVLADLYPLAGVAFVGGSFKKKVHSVMEALGAGKIVIVGPYFENNREAVEFHDVLVHEDIRAVNVVRDSKEFESLVLKISALSPESLKAAENVIRAQFQRRLGATAKVIDWCDFHLENNGTFNIPIA